MLLLYATPLLYKYILYYIQKLVAIEFIIKLFNYLARREKAFLIFALNLINLKQKTLNKSI